MHRKASATEIARIDKGSVKCVLSLGDLFAIGYGDLGSSIYYALGITALFALGATPIALALAGFVFICTALSYAELSAMYPESGGSASFARHAFNDIASFIAGWGLLLDYIVTIAISAFAISPYLAIFFDPLKNSNIQISFTVGVIAVLFVVNLFGVRRSTRISFGLMVLALLTQIVIIIMGVVLLLDLPLILHHFKIGVPGVDWSPSWPDFMRGVAMAMVAFTGIESIAQLGSESRQPKKDIPRAIFLNIVALIALYLGIAIVALSALTPQELGHRFADDPIAGIVQAFPIGGAFFGTWIGLLAPVLLLVAANAGMLGSARLANYMGNYYQLPQFFSTIHSRFHTPVFSMAFFAVLACILVVASRGHLTNLADLYNFGAMVAFFSTNMSLLVLRIKKPHEARPFRIPFHIRFRGADLPISAIIGAIATLGVWILIVVTKPHGRYLGLAWMIFGVTVFLLYRHKKKLSTGGRLAVHKVHVEKLVQHKVKQILVPIQSIVEQNIIYAACEVARTHHAGITLLHIIEVPIALPLESEMPERQLGASDVLRYAEAIVRENDIAVEHLVLRGRAFSEVLTAVLKDKKWELVVLPGSRWDRATHHALSALLEQKLFRAWIHY